MVIASESARYEEGRLEGVQWQPVHIDLLELPHSTSAADRPTQ